MRFVKKQELDAIVLYIKNISKLFAFQFNITYSFIKKLLVMRLNIISINRSYLHIIRILIIFFVVLKVSNVAWSQTCKEVIGYYPSWQWYDRNKLVKPTTIDYSQYSIINYAFLYPKADGHLTITDPWADKNLLLGDFNWATAPAGYDSGYDLGNPAYHQPNTSIVYHAHQNNTLVMLSIGGWTLSNDFPAIAADPTKRTNFAHSCSETVRLYGIDGIDIDWEYPGYASHNGTPNDKVNYTLLLKEVRDSLDVLEQALSKNLLLTAAFGAAPDRMSDIEWHNVVPLLDYINLMSYDFFGAFSPETNHNAALYAPAVGDSTFNIHSAVERLTTTYNVPASKINIGIAFYGRSAKTTAAAGLHVSTTGTADNATFSLDDGSPLYYNILKQQQLFITHWDSQAEVPYLTGTGSLQTFVSYDDEQSIGLKGKYVVDNQLAGVIIWEITGDYIESPVGVISGTPLADTLNKALCHAPTVISNVNTVVNEVSIDIYPNPVNDHLQIKTMIPEKDVWVKVYNSLGIIVLEQTLEQKVIDIKHLPVGQYVLTISTKEQMYTKTFSKL